MTDKDEYRWLVTVTEGSVLSAEHVEIVVTTTLNPLVALAEGAAMMLDKGIFPHGTLRADVRRVAR